MDAARQWFFQSMADSGLIFSRIHVLLWFGNEGDFLVPGDPTWDSIRKAKPYQKFIEYCENVDVTITKSCLLLGDKPARSATMAELDLLISCYEFFQEAESFKLLSRKELSVLEQHTVKPCNSEFCPPVSNIDLLPF